MSKHYGAIAFTEAVRDVQRDHGSHVFYDRKRIQGAAVPGADALTEDEKDYLAERDSFYLATISETGWPYVQFRGGPTGFLRVVDDHTIGWADFRGNLQYISTGNVAGDNRVALIAVDYLHQRRLKVYGHARIVTAEQDPTLVGSFANPLIDGRLLAHFHIGGMVRDVKQGRAGILRRSRDVRLVSQSRDEGENTGLGFHAIGG